jgi:hypothetical protein
MFRTVILSGTDASPREASTPSNDPYHDPRIERGLSQGTALAVPTGGSKDEGFSPCD